MAGEQPQNVPAEEKAAAEAGEQPQNVPVDEKAVAEAVSKLRRLLDEARRRKLSFLLTGRTGVGKSSTINSLMGQQVATVGDFAPETVTVQHYNHQMEGVHYVVIDTPGLCDALPEEGNDYEYLRTIQDNVKEFDSLWFVSRLDETRVSSDELRGIQLISESFGSEAWERAVVILTFADRVPADKYQYQIEGRSRVVRAAIAKWAGIDIAAQVPVVAVTNQSQTTPDGTEWVSELFTQVIVRIRQKKALPFLMALAPRIKNPVSDQILAATVGSSWQSPGPSQGGSPAEGSQQFSLDERQQRQVTERLYTEISADIIVNLTSAGAGIGALVGTVGGPVGVAIGAGVGGAVGAVIGAIAWFTRRR